MRKVPLKTIFQANTNGYSSKRVFGAIGFLTSICIGVACTIMGTQAPTLVIDILYASVALLGVDSVTGIWKTRASNIHQVNQHPALQEESAIEDDNYNYEYTRNNSDSEER